MELCLGFYSQAIRPSLAASTNSVQMGLELFLVVELASLFFALHLLLQDADMLRLLQFLWTSSLALRGRALPYLQIFFQ